MNSLRALWADLQRFFARRRARRLLAQALPRGLAQPTALPAPAPPEPGPLDYPALPFFGQSLREQRAPRPLLRLSALPPERPDLSALRVLPARPSLAAPPRLPALLELHRPLTPRAGRLVTLRPREPHPELPGRPAPVPLRLPALPLDRPRPDLGQARPDRLRLDAALTLPPERDPTVISADRASIAPERRVRPRTPLARAPLSRVEPRAFRLDPQTARPANEGIIPLERRSPEYWWIPAAFRAAYLDPRGMSRSRFKFLGPMHAEWFVLWWDQHARKKPGARTAIDYVQPEELYWLMQECKEQMLIRRDVKKDEQPPEEQEFFYIEEGVGIFQAEPPEIVALLPEVSWVHPPKLEPTVDLDAQPVRDAYVQWRTLVGALAEK